MRFSFFWVRVGFGVFFEVLFSQGKGGRERGGRKRVSGGGTGRGVGMKLHREEAS